MVVASGGWVKYANSPASQNTSQNSSQNNTNLNASPNNKMTAKGILICRENSHHFEERTLSLQNPVRIGRSVGKVRATNHNAIFDCKVLSRNHALLWYSSGKFYLQDTRSSNGTFINNERLSASGLESAPIEVCSGDVVQFGVDVVESAKKVRHGCIIATLKLYLPDGKEAKASLYTSIADLYKLNQVVQEASKRERSLYSKLGHLQKLVENTRNAANQSWKALIAEDHLLSWVETLESQLAIYKKNYSEDKAKNELIKLQEEKTQYQNTAKEALQKVLQEKLDVTQRLVELETRLSETEEECQSLHNVAKYTQTELQELSSKYVEVEKQLQDTTYKLVQQEEKCKEIMQNAEQEKCALQKKLEEQYKLEICLEARLRNSRIDSVNIHKQITALRNYMQTLQDMNSKIMSDEMMDCKEEQNPIEAINAILNQLNSINADNIDVNSETDVYLNKTDHDNQLNSQDIDSNQLKVMNADSSFVKDQLDESGNMAEYILPPPSRRTLVNGNVDVEIPDSNAKSDTDFEMTDDTCSVNDDSCSITSDDLSEKSVIEVKNEKDTAEMKDSFGPQKLEVRFACDENGEQLRTSYEPSDDRTIEETNELSNTANNSDEFERFSEKAADLLQRRSSKRDKRVRESSRNLDTSDSPTDLKSMFDRLIATSLSMIPDKNDKTNELEEATYCTEPCKRQSDSESVPGTTARTSEEGGKREVKFTTEYKLELADQECTKTSKSVGKADKVKGDMNRSTETAGEDEHLNEEYTKTLKPLSKSDSMGQNLQSREYVLETLIRSLQSLKDEDNLQAQQVVRRELEELRDWLSSESTDIVVDRLKDVYYRVKNEAQRVQEVNEELVILKEKYNAFVEEKAELTKKYTTLKTQCGDLLNATYTIPIHYVAPIVLALIWMLLEKIF